MSENIRFFIDADEDGNWYFIPESKRDAWINWLATDFAAADLMDCVVPEFAVDIEGPNLLTFTDPQEV